MSIKLFIAGTDTNVGKTYTSIGLLKAFHQLGLSTIGIKPLASGCTALIHQGKSRLINNDALLLQSTSSIQLDYEKINPFAFEPPIAPHIAAQQIQQTLNVQQLTAKTFAVLHHAADVYLIEGVGGWYVPLNKEETMADFVCENKLSVILVIGMRLGCLNHALLTFKAMQHDAIHLVGWIANCMEHGMPFCYENILTLQNWITAPLLGVVNYNEQPEHKINCEQIINSFLQ